MSEEMVLRFVNVEFDTDLVVPIPIDAKPVVSPIGIAIVGPSAGETAVASVATGAGQSPWAWRIPSRGVFHTVTVEIRNVESPASLTREMLGDVVSKPEASRLGGFVAALLDAYGKADAGNRAALASGFEWLPDMHAARVKGWSDA